MAFDKLIILATETTAPNAVKAAVANGRKLRTGAKDKDENRLTFCSGNILIFFDGEISGLDALADVEELKDIVQMPLIAVEGNYSMDGFRLANLCVIYPSDMLGRVSELVESGIFGTNPFVMPYEALPGASAG